MIFGVDIYSYSSRKLAKCTNCIDYKLCINLSYDGLTLAMLIELINSSTTLKNEFSSILYYYVHVIYQIKILL